MELLNKLKINSKSSIAFISLIALLSFYLLRADLQGGKVQYAGDSRDQFLADKTAIRNAVVSGVFPLWSPFLMSGQPLFAKAQNGVISINTLIEFISWNVYFTMFLNAFIHLLLLGFGMFLLCRAINLENRYAFVASLTLMLSSYVASSIFYVTFQFMGLAFAPYVIMFTIKGTKSSKWIKYAIYSGIFLAFEFLEGAFEVFTFTAMIVCYILFFNLIGRKFWKRLLKLILFGVLIFGVTIGISSIKLLPAIELANISNRQQPFDFETSLGTHITPENFFRSLIEGRKLSAFFEHPLKGTGNVEIGIISAILILISIFNIKKKNYLLFFGMMFFGILMITNSPLIKLLWAYFPYFNKQKHVIKAVVIFLLAASVMTAYGISYIISRIKDKKIAGIAYTAIVVLLIITSWGFTYNSKLRTPYPELKSIEVMKYMSNDKELFRFKAWETNGIDWGSNYYSIYYGLYDIYGYVNMWELDYLPDFLSVANRQPAKFFGMLNMKYLTSMQEINISGFKLVKKFDDSISGCKYKEDATLIESPNSWHCPEYSQLKKAWGPYLYLNERFMSKAYLVEHGILIVGKRDITKQLAYQLMLDEGFNPSNNVIILGRESINQYTQDELSEYSAILLSQGSIDQNSIQLLKRYKEKGGRLLPDVLDSKNAITQEDIIKMFGVFSGRYTPAEYKEINYNHYNARVSGGKFLVLSEKFSVYQGWRAFAGKKSLEILNANVMNSAVYTGGSDMIIDFKYMPNSFKKGLIITFATVILIFIYFGYKAIARTKNKSTTNNTTKSMEQT